MTPDERPAAFLERRSYRQRRLMDALRLLPFLGLLLWMLPLFWPNPAEQVGQTVSTSTAVTYVFAIWVVLIAAAFALSRSLRDRLSADVRNDDEQGAP